MKLNRRDALFGALFGGTMIGLRSIATGLPVRFLMNPRKALADTQTQTCATTNAQFVILSTSGAGDPIGCNAPGTYDDPNVPHPKDDPMAKTALTIRGQTTYAAAPWATLGPTGANVLDRTCFCHIATTTPVHPKEPDVLSLMGASVAREMFPSILSAALHPCLGTLQPQPIAVGASTPSESLTFKGQALPTVPPKALRATLVNTAGELTSLQQLRDTTLSQLYQGVYRTSASASQKQFIDSMVSSQSQVRNIDTDYLNALASIQDNTEASQILAAVALIQMKVSPVVTVHFGFGGDNHNDTDLQSESTGAQNGCASIVTLMQALQAAGLADKVTFASLNVFGRTMNAKSMSGRDHNKNHQMSLVIGKGFKGGVIGGIAPVAGDYASTGIDPTTGAASTSGSAIQPADSLASWAKTVMTGVGVSSDVVAQQVTSGTLIQGALAS